MTYRQMQQQSRNAEESLLAAYAACAFVTQEVSATASLLQASNVHNWLNRLQSEWTAERIEFARKCLIYLNLTAANLRGTHLSGANLSGSDLSAADLSAADLSMADLTGVNLTGATLTRASLTGADLTKANLTGANLTRANLTRANLTRVILDGADLTGANWWEADPRSFTGNAGYTLHQYLESDFPNPQAQMRNGP